MNSISPNTLLLGAIIVFVLGAIVGGKIVTTLFHAFGGHRRERYRRDRRYHRPYDDDGDDDYQSANHSGLFLLALISLVIGGVGIKKALNNAGETSVSPKDPATVVTEIAPPSRVQNSADGHDKSPKGPQIFDPEYKPTPSPSSSPSVAEASVGEEYIVQLDAYNQKSNADKQMAGLQAKGFPTGYYIKERGDGVIYVVYTGPYHSSTDANWSNRTYFGNQGLVKVAGDLELNRY